MKTLVKYLIAFIFLVLIAACEKDDSGSGDPSKRTDGPESFASETTDISDAGTSDDGSGDDGTNQDGGDNIEPGSMTAGEWNDLENWNFWNDLIQNEEYFNYQNHWNFHPNQRYSIALTDNNGKAVIDATVELKTNQGESIWKTKSDNKGIAELWVGMFNDNKTPQYISVSYAGEEYTVNPIHSILQGINNFTVPINRTVPDKLDVVFVVDATGSMGDEIDYLKAELLSVMNRVKTQQNNLSVQLGAVFYRDEGDEYVTRSFPLSIQIDDIVASVSQQSASGGGDYPEAVHSALENAVLQQQWSNNAISRIVFLILDAPPHHEPAVITNLQQTIQKAASYGVKIIPVTASGINKETEFLMRYFAIATNGTYVFITDHSGIGGDHLEPTTGDYQVELLDDLLVRLITEYSTPQ